MFENDTPYNLTKKKFTRKLTTWIIYSLVGKSTLFYIYISEDVIYHKLIALFIKYKLIEKVDYIDWFARLTKKLK